MTPRARRHVVVGAGTSGCVVAARLAQLAAEVTGPARPEVVLIEAGPDLRPGQEPAIDGPDPLAPSGLASRWWAGPTGPTGPTGPDGPAPRTLLRGRTVGGSSAVNGTVLAMVPRSDHDRWVAGGAVGWSWEACAPARARVLATVPRTRIPRSGWGPLPVAVSDALLDAGVPWRSSLDPDRPGVGSATLARDPVSGRRWTAAERLEPVRGSLTLLTGTEVVDLLLDDRAVAVRGVRTADGAEIEADTVTLCAGAIGSPALLLRAGLADRFGTPGIGEGLQDHPSLVVTLPGLAGGPVICSRWQAPGVQVMPVAPDALLVALMRPRSSGHLRLAPGSRTGPPTGPPTGPALLADPGLFTAPEDVRAMAALLGSVLGLLSGRRLAPWSETATVGDPGLSLPAVRSLLNDPDALAADELLDARHPLGDWLRAQTGRYSHATGGCRIGTTVDTAGRVRTGPVSGPVTGLRVADLSILPDVPTANPMFAALLVGEHLTGAVGVTAGGLTGW